MRTRSLEGTTLRGGRVFPAAEAFVVPDYSPLDPRNITSNCTLHKRLLFSSELSLLRYESVKM